MLDSLTAGFRSHMRERFRSLAAKISHDILFLDRSFFNVAFRVKCDFRLLLGLSIKFPSNSIIDHIDLLGWLTTSACIKPGQLPTFFKMSNVHGVEWLPSKGASNNCLITFQIIICIMYDQIIFIQYRKNNILVFLYTNCTSWPFCSRWPSQTIFFYEIWGLV